MSRRSSHGRRASAATHQGGYHDLKNFPANHSADPTGDSIAHPAEIVFGQGLAGRVPADNARHKKNDQVEDDARH
jgi:hypothetical protein